MVKKKKKKKKNSKSDNSWWHKPLLFVLRILPWLIVLPVFIWSLWVGANTFWQKLTHHPAFEVSPQDVIYDMPAAVREDNMSELIYSALGDVIKNANIFDRSLNQRVEQKLHRLPWVTHVDDVTRNFPDKLTASLRFRSPAGLVEFANMHYMIDRDGYWLPEELYLVPAEWKGGHFPVIIHKNLPDRFPPQGRQWEAKGLPIGARLTQFLLREDMLDVLDIKEIHVSSVGRRDRISRESTDIALITEKGAVVGWGTTEEYENISGLAQNRRVDEPSDYRKLQALKNFLNEYPDLKGISHIDLRFNKVSYEMMD